MNITIKAHKEESVMVNWKNLDTLASYQELAEDKTVSSWKK